MARFGFATFRTQNRSTVFRPGGFSWRRLFYGLWSRVQASRRFNTATMDCRAFPYDSSDALRPVSLRSLRERSPLLAQFYLDERLSFEAQTAFSDKIRGSNPGEFYGVARTGPYSFAPIHVGFRDNTSWSAMVVDDIEMPWGEIRHPVFQNHAASVCERPDGSSSHWVRPTTFVPFSMHRLFEPIFTRHLMIARSRFAHLSTFLATTRQTRLTKRSATYLGAPMPHQMQSTRR